MASDFKSFVASAVGLEAGREGCRSAAERTASLPLTFSRMSREMKPKRNVKRPCERKHPVSAK